MKKSDKAINRNIKEIFININFDGIHETYKEKVDVTNKEAVEKAKDKIIKKIIKDIEDPSFIRGLIDTATMDLAAEELDLKKLRTTFKKRKGSA